MSAADDMGPDSDLSKVEQTLEPDVQNKPETPEILASMIEEKSDIGLDYSSSLLGSLGTFGGGITSMTGLIFSEVLGYVPQNPEGIMIGSAIAGGVAGAAYPILSGNRSKRKEIDEELSRWYFSRGNGLIGPSNNIQESESAVYFDFREDGQESLGQFNSESFRILDGDDKTARTRYGIGADAAAEFYDAITQDSDMYELVRIDQEVGGRASYDLQLCEGEEVKGRIMGIMDEGDMYLPGRNSLLGKAIGNVDRRKSKAGEFMDALAGN